MTSALDRINRRIIGCSACPRLVAWRQEAAANPPRRFRGQRYWARPVPGFGDPQARLLIVGLAPAANGGNRTGRIFTGDSSGDFLFRALFDAGFSNQPTSVRQDDGLVLRGVYVSAAARCAPPDNRPTREEFTRCRPFLVEEMAALEEVRVVVPLGALAWAAVLGSLAACGVAIPRPAPRFSHGAEVALPGDLHLVGSYHVSQQNTNTGRLTPVMLAAVFDRVRRMLGI